MVDELVQKLNQNEKVSFKEGLLRLYKELQQERTTWKDIEEVDPTQDDYPKENKYKNQANGMEDGDHESFSASRRMNLGFGLKGKILVALKNTKCNLKTQRYPWISN